MNREHTAPAGRLSYEGDLTPVVTDICDAYSLGQLNSFSVIDVGYEDCNVRLQAEGNEYMAKLFASNRSPEEITRYLAIMEQVLAAGVQHPALVYTQNGDVLHRSGDISLALMQFVAGSTFYGLDRIPSSAERQAVLAQAARINSIDYHPPYLFDSWAIPHIHTLFELVQSYLSPHDKPLVEEVMRRYDQIPADNLPHAFVHGDLTKTNIIKGNDGKIYVIDFSVANWYPRIQELAVIAANLLYEPNGLPLAERCEQVADEYSRYAPLSPLERQHLYAYALAGVAMEFLGAHKEKYINKDEGEETAYWLTLGRTSLQRELIT